MPAALPPLLPGQAFGKKKLRWKKIGEHLGHKAKACRKHYTKLTGKDAPSDDE